MFLSNLVTTDCPDGLSVVVIGWNNFYFCHVLEVMCVYIYIYLSKDLLKHLGNSFKKFG